MVRGDIQVNDWVRRKGMNTAGKVIFTSVRYVTIINHRTGRRHGFRWKHVEKLGKREINKLNKVKLHEIN